MAEELATLGVVVTGSGLDETTSKLNQFKQAGASAEAQAKNLKQADDLLSKSLNELSSNTASAAQAQAQLNTAAGAAAHAQKQVAQAAAETARANQQNTTASNGLNGAWQKLVQTSKDLVQGFREGAREGALMAVEEHKAAMAAQDLAAANDNAAGKTEKHRQIIQRFGSTLRQMGIDVPQWMDPALNSLARFSGNAAIMGPTLLGVTAAGGAMAVVFKEINDRVGNDLTKNLGLTAEQLERVKDKGVTLGDTLKAVWQETAEGVNTNFGGAVKAAQDYINQLIDNTSTEIGNIVGFFNAAYRMSIEVWKRFPGAFSDLIVSGVNLGITAIENMINAVTNRVNGIINLANAAAKIAKVDIQLPTIPRAELARVKNANEGAMRDFGTALSKAGSEGFAAGQAAWGQAVDAVVRRAIENARSRILKEAGDAAKSGGGRTGSSSGKSEYEKAIDDSVRFLAQLEQETAAIGKNTYELKQMAVARAAAAAPTEELRKAILAAGEAWETASRHAEAYNRHVKEVAGKDWVGITNSAGVTVYDKLTQVGPRVVDGLIAPENDPKFKEFGRRLAEATKNPLHEILGGTLEDIFIRGARAAFDGDFKSFAKGIFSDVFSSTLKKAISDIKSGNFGSTNSITSLMMAGGQAIGGFGGGILSGAGMGASIGSVIPGVGTLIGGAVGGLIGGITSLFGGGSKKKEEQERQRQLQLQQAAAAQAEADRIAAEATNLRIETLRLEGKETEALALERENELKATSEANRAAKERVFQLQDEFKAAQEAKAAAEAALELERKRQGLMVEWFRAQNREAEALTLERKLELEQTEESLRGLKQEIWAFKDAAKAAEDAAREAAKQLETMQRAQEDARAGVNAARSALLDSYHEEESRLKGVASQMNNLADSISNFRRGLEVADETLSPEERYKRLSAEFQQVSSAAQAGDPKALERVQDISQQYLDASRKYYGSSEGYFRDFATVRNALLGAEARARAEASTAQQQLAGITATVGQLIQLNNTSIGIQAGILALNNAIQLLAAAAFRTAQVAGPQIQAQDPNRVWANTAAPSGNTTANIALAQATGYTGNFGSGGFQSWITQQDPTTQEIARQVLRNAGQENRIAFANGGIAGGGIVAKHTAFEVAEFNRPEAILPLANIGGKLGVSARFDGEAIDLLKQQNALLKQAIEALQGANMQRGEAATRTLNALGELLETNNKQTREQRRAAAAK